MTEAIFVVEPVPDTGGWVFAVQCEHGRASLPIDEEPPAHQFPLLAVIVLAHHGAHWHCTCAELLWDRYFPVMRERLMPGYEGELPSFPDLASTITDVLVEQGLMAIGDLNTPRRPLLRIGKSAAAAIVARA
jgi:hypothetical protein